MYQLVYASTATNLMRDEELLTILEQSRQNNQELDVTGILLYKEGSFIQTLEGEKEVVKELYEKITTDKRHAGLMVLHEGEVEERLFPDWSMGFQNFADLTPDDVPGYSDYFEDPLSGDYFQNRPTRIHILLRAFTS